MSPSSLATTLAASIGAMGAVTLNDLCTSSYAASVLPASSTVPGITIDSSSVSASLTTNSSVSSEWYPSATLDYCNVTFAYSHNGLTNDVVHVSYLVPSPDTFSNRYVSTGGGGLAINSGSSYAPSGIIVGAVSGITDGGFGNFDTQWDAVFLEANGTINWQATYMFGYQAHHELALLGKAFTKSFFNMTDSTKLYSYYQGCSEGGLVTGAPAFRYGQQQVNHLVGNVVEQTRNYYPPPCELEKIMNLTIAACDPLDGNTDGVIARSDLCGLSFDVNSTIGQAYYCAAAETSLYPGGPTSATPEQTGTVSAEGAAVAAEILAGLHTSDGKRVYINYQPGASWVDAATSYDNTTQTWGLSISSLGGEWVARYLQLRDTSDLTAADLANVTYDTLKDWMVLGMNRYADSLQTTYPDLTDFAAAGSKLLHLHGEQDNSIPTGSSVHYYESVRSVMYPSLSYNDSVAQLDDFYRLFLVPGAAHCQANSYQANGGWPQTTLQTVIEWVEGKSAPDMLNGTGSATEQMCRWPMRPLWEGNASTPTCVYDQKSIDTWNYTFDAYKLPLY
jgi:tannase